MRSPFRHVCRAALALTISCTGCGRQDPPPADPVVLRPIPAPTYGPVAWLPPEALADTSARGLPTLVFIHSVRSFWSREMVNSLSDREVALEIGRVTRPVIVDADLRPDLADRFSLGALPSLAVLTPDLRWITGTTFAGAEDLEALMRRVRILHDVPERMADVERERARLLRRRPVRDGRFVARENQRRLADAVTDSIRSAERPSFEGIRLLAEAGDTATARSRLDTAAGDDRLNGAGLLVAALLTADGRIRDETTSLALNASAVSALAAVGDLTGDEGSRSRAEALAHAVVDAYYDAGRETFVTGTADYYVDSTGAVLPVVAEPPLVDTRSITAWNAAAVSALCAAGEPGSELVATAVRVLDRLLATRVRNGDVVRLAEDTEMHQPEDAAHLARACLDVAAVTGDEGYLDRARALVEAVREHGAEVGAVGADGDLGSAAGVFAQVLARLGRVDGAEEVCRAAIAREVERWGRLGAVGRAARMVLRLKGERE